MVADGAPAGPTATAHGGPRCRCCPRKAGSSTFRAIGSDHRGRADLRRGGLPGSVREEIHELVSLLLQVSERRGFIDLQPGWCWGGGCRAIKRSDGTLTDTPSNHSWGLALDINAPENVFGGATHTIPVEMARLWNTYGFRWGGDYPDTKDWMHFEFMGTPADAREMTEKAREQLAEEVEGLTPSKSRRSAEWRSSLTPWQTPWASSKPTRKAMPTRRRSAPRSGSPRPSSEPSGATSRMPAR